MTTVTTRQQRMAERSYGRVSDRHTKKRSEFKEYASFAKSFPALLHAAGLCQAVAFAQAKGGTQSQVLEDVVAAAGLAGIDKADDLRARSHKAGVVEYLRLSRATIQAATWIKRYAEAFEKSEPRPTPETQT